MKSGIIVEYLGEVSTDLLLRNLTNTREMMVTFPAISPIDAFGRTFPHGFMVSAQVEMSIFETHEEHQDAIEVFQ